MFFVYGLILLILLYFILAPRLAPWLYRPMIFPRLRMHSHEPAPVMAGLTGKAVQFKQGDGNLLRAWYYENPNANLTMLVSHGNVGNLATHSYLTEALIGAGYSVFIYDYSGYGASSGMPYLNTVTNDALAAYDYLFEKENIAPENIILYGESIGVAIAAYLATRRKAKALICQSGFASFRRIATERVPFLHLYPNWLFPNHCLDTMKSFMAIEIPLLIIHGEKDDVVPFSHAETLLKYVLHKRKKLIPFADCDHKNITFADKEMFINTINDFLTTHIKLETELNN